MAAAHAAAASGRTYRYAFAWRSDALSGQLGASHVMETPFVFDRLTLASLPGHPTYGRRRPERRSVIATRRPPVTASSPTRSSAGAVSTGTRPAGTATPPTRPRPQRSASARPGDC